MRTAEALQIASKEMGHDIKTKTYGLIFLAREETVREGYTVGKLEV